MNGKNNSKGHIPPKSPGKAPMATPLASKQPLSANPVAKKVLKLGSNSVQIIPVGQEKGGPRAPSVAAANPSSGMSEKKRGK